MRKIKQEQVLEFLLNGDRDDKAIQKTYEEIMQAKESLVKPKKGLINSVTALSIFSVLLVYVRHAYEVSLTEKVDWLLAAMLLGFVVQMVLWFVNSLKEVARIKKEIKWREDMLYQQITTKKVKV